MTLDSDNNGASRTPSGGRVLTASIIYYYIYSIIYSLVAFPLTPKYVTLNDFEWLEWPVYVICSLLRTATDSLFVIIYCRLFITRDVTNGEVRKSEYSKE